ncbi:MAG: 5-formyltetrahydrofolate cyclo-ligase [Pseudomonadota bacterium]
MDLADEKSRLRKQGFAARKIANGDGLDAQANAHLIKTVAAIPDVKSIAGYMPIRTEVSPLEAMSAWHGQGYEVSVPVIIAESTPLKWAVWTPEGAMEEGAFGARIPKNAAFTTPDLLVCPLVAFDARGGRLGYGGGFYDRSLAELRRQKTTYAVGFAYSAQELPNVPQEQTDLPLDCVVTERGRRDF